MPPKREKIPLLIWWLKLGALPGWVNVHAAFLTPAPRPLRLSCRHLRRHCRPNCFQKALCYSNYAVSSLGGNVPGRKLTAPSSSWTKFLPKLGVGVASHGLPLSTLERHRLARLHLNYLRVDIHFSRANWKTALRQAYDEAIGIGSRLQCALFLNNSAERCLSNFREMIGPDAVDWCLIFHEAKKSTSSHWFELAERSLAPHGFRLATGTNAYFAELNRQRPPRNAVVCYSFNPQVHAFDDLSLIETLEAQPATVQSALQFCDRGLILSPVTL
jgi:D-apionolactonase